MRVSGSTLRSSRGIYDAVSYVYSCTGKLKAHETLALRPMDAESLDLTSKVMAERRCSKKAPEAGNNR